MGYLPVVGCLLVVLTGCPKPEPGETDRAGHSLRLAVAGDPALADAIEQLRGEWAGLWGAEFHLQQVSVAELEAADQIDADAIICPSHQLGTLAAAGQLAPIPQNLLVDKAGHTPDETSGWSDLFSLIRSREIQWGSDVLAVPFGSPVLTCYYRKDLLEKLDRRPPESWAEYQELAQLLDELHQSPDGDLGGVSSWHGAIEPNGPGWAGQVLLARSAAYASHRENFSALFNLADMEPLIAGPPFVRALEEQAAVAALCPLEQVDFDPAAVRNAFWAGRCGLALSWPTAASTESAPDAADFPVGFAELPGSVDVYNFIDSQWEAREPDEDPHVPLLSIAGRIGVVTARSQWPEEAVELLLWLSGEQARQISTASEATTLFRSSQAASAKAWVEKPVPAAAAGEYAALVEQTLSRSGRMFSLRIPGRSEYLDALDEAVYRVIRGEQTAAESLAVAATRWQEITDRLGQDRQAEAYCQSLGLD